MAGWLAFVDDMGHFALDKPREFKSWLQKFRGQEVVVSIKRRYYSRQGTQSMRYYRGVVVPDIAAACGYTDPDEYEDVHDALAWKFLRLPDGMFGQPRRRSTAKDDLNQAEMSQYIDQVIAFAETSIPGCQVRRPEDVDLDQIMDPGWH